VGNDNSAAFARVLCRCMLLAAFVGCGENAAPGLPASPSIASRRAPAPFNLRVEVFTPSGRPLHGAAVRVAGPTPAASGVSIRRAGAAHEIGIPVPGVVTLRVEVRGYDAVEKELIVTSDAQLDVTLPRANAPF
jgi:hypothetical protein